MSRAQYPYRDLLLDMGDCSQPVAHARVSAKVMPRMESQVAQLPLLLWLLQAVANASTLPACQ
jgi:hypothetical protein